MRKLKSIISVLAIVGFFGVLTAFNNQSELSEQQKVYEFETVTVVESLIKGGLGRSRMISGTETVDYKQATTIRKEDGEKEKSKKDLNETYLNIYY